MKTPILLFFFIITLVSGFLSCTKQNALLVADDALSGKWTWVRTDGGIANNIHNTPASTGSNIQLEFKEGNNYTFYTNGATQSKGTYQLKKGISITDGKEKDLIDLSDNGDLLILKIDATTLLVTDNYFDGTTSQYTKSGK